MRVALIGALPISSRRSICIPDVLPIIGFTDDAAVMAGAIKLVWDSIKPEHRDAARDALERMNEASETLDVAHGFSTTLPITLRAGDVLQRLRRVRQRIGRVDMRAELALGAPADEVGGVGAVRLRLALRSMSPRTRRGRRSFSAAPG